jgi:signal transduction histidine kinase
VKLARQLSLAFAGVAAAPVLAAAPLVLHTVADAVQDEVERRLDAAARAVDGERRALADEVTAGLAAAASSDTVREILAERAVPAAAPSPPRVDAAGELVRGTSLDVLALLDDDGRVISSGHLPARVGDRDPALAGAGGAAVRRVEVRTAAGIVPTLALVAGRGVTSAGARVQVVAGKTLDGAVARRLAAVAAAHVDVVELASGRTVASAGALPIAPPAGPLDRLALALLHEPALPSRTLDLPGPDGRPAARLVVAVDAGGPGRARARILVQSAAILFAALALAAALGALLARRIVRPVEALAAGAARVAGGDLSTRVEARAGAEVGALVTAFNAMTLDLERTRERAAVAERVAAWREVARRLAHEVKNPLTPIAMAIETLRDARAADSPLVDELFETSSTTILAEVARLKRIVDEFSRFARLPAPALGPVDLPELAESLLALHGAAGDGTLRRELDPATPTVRADRDQVVQVLVNLLDNARAAAGAAGTVVVRVGPTPESGAFLEVEDDGPGIAAADRERIFEPYFTTKGAGTGLGLPIARRIAEEHGGRLEVESAPGRGARFRLTLPPAGPGAR